MFPVTFLGIWMVAGLFVVSRDYRRLIGSSVLAGVALGLWTIAPQLVRVNHLHDLSFRQWLIVDGVLSAAFATIAFIIGIAASWLFCAYWKVRRREALTPGAAWAFATALLPMGYLAISWWFEWHNFRSRPRIGPNAGVVLPATCLALVMGSCAAALRRSRQWATWPSIRVLSLSAVALATVACCVLPLRVRVREFTTDAPASLDPLTPRPGIGHVRPLLVIGLDGGNWETMRPLFERRPDSTFARLASTGVSGTIEALWPPYWSTPAWGAIVTGYPEGQLGIHEDLSATARGLPRFELPLTLDPLLDPMLLAEYTLIEFGAIVPAPAPREALREPPVWERLSAAGIKTAVVRFPFTYPADHQAAYVVSNRVVTDLWSQLGVKPGRLSDLVGPPEEAPWLRGALASKTGVDGGLSARLLPRADRAKPRDAIENPADVLDKVLAISQQMFSTTEQVIQHDPAVRVVMLHVTDFDNICHAFWQYRFPDSFSEDRPTPSDVARLGAVVDRYLEYVDRRVGELIAAFPEAPNVIVVADHGEGPTAMASLWRGWHSKFGVFLAAGPDVDRQPGDRVVSYYDVTPTIISLAGLEPARDLSGASIFENR